MNATETLTDGFNGHIRIHVSNRCGDEGSDGELWALACAKNNRGLAKIEHDFAEKPTGLLRGQNLQKEILFFILIKY